MAENENNISEIPEWRNNAVLLFVELLFMPKQGWKRVKSSKLTVQKTVSQCYLPLLIMAAASTVFNTLFYLSGTWFEGILQGFLIFMNFFISRYACIAACSAVFGNEYRKKTQTRFGHIYITMCLSSLLLWYILWQLLYIMAPLIIFLPLYTVYLIISGMKTLRIGIIGDESSVLLRLCAVIIGIPVLIYWMFNLINV